MAKRTDDNMTRREAVKRMGLVAASIGLGLTHADTVNLSSSDYNRKDMKVLLVNGSPHKEGCTFTA